MYLPNEDYVKLHSLDYLEWMRQQPCCLTGNPVADLHHLEAIGTRGHRKEPNQRHFTVVPLVREKHSELHDIGIHKFQEKYNIQLWQDAYYYFAKWLLLNIMNKPKPQVYPEGYSQNEQHGDD